MLVAAQARGEAAVQDIVATRLDALGGEVRVIDYAPDEVPVVDEFATATMSDPGRRQKDHQVPILAAVSLAHESSVAATVTQAITIWR